MGFLIYYSITVWSAAPQTTLWGGPPPGPRYEPRPGDPEAGTPPLDHHTSSHENWQLLENISLLSSESRKMNLNNFFLQGSLEESTCSLSPRPRCSQCPAVVAHKCRWASGQSSPGTRSSSPSACPPSGCTFASAGTGGSVWYPITRGGFSSIFSTLLMNDDSHQDVKNTIINLINLNFSAFKTNKFWIPELLDC